jgi:hypothetical protein
VTDDEERQLREILDRLKSVEQNVLVGNQEVFNNALYLETILDILRGSVRQITDFTLLERQGDTFMAIIGINLGAATPNVFQIGFVPPNGVPLPTPPTVTVDDPAVVLGAVSTDGQFTFTATAPTTDTGASCNITVAGTNATGTALTHTFNVPLIATAPPQITDFSLNQLS